MINLFNRLNVVGRSPFTFYFLQSTNQVSAPSITSGKLHTIWLSVAECYNIYIYTEFVGSSAPGDLQIEVETSNSLTYSITVSVYQNGKCFFWTYYTPLPLYWELTSSCHMSMIFFLLLLLQILGRVLDSPLEGVLIAQGAVARPASSPMMRP